MEKENWQILEIPYQGREIILILFLPRTTTESRWCPLIDNGLNPLLDRMEMREIMIRIPRFHGQFHYQLKELLQSIGIRRAFSHGADFSGIAPGIVMDQIIHEARLEVDEGGTEAVSGNVVTFKKGSNAEFNADHPFQFMIIHCETDAILFSGWIGDPGAQNN